MKSSFSYLCATVAIVVLMCFNAYSYNDLGQLHWDIQRQTDAIEDAAWQMRRAAEAEEASVAIAIQAERRRRMEAEEAAKRAAEAARQAAEAEATRRKEHEEAMEAESIRLAEEQKRTQLEAMRLAEVLQHNAEMEKIKKCELEQKQKERDERNAYRCEWVENGLRCPSMKVAGGMFCENHAEIMRMKHAAQLARQAKEREAERLYREYINSLPPCKYSGCKKSALPRSEFCARHQPIPKSDYDGLGKEEASALRVTKTKETIAALELNIATYRKSTNGGLPESIQELRIALGAAVSRCKDEWGTDIYYETDGSSSYALESAGPDMKFETRSDNITVIRTTLPPLK